ncbi:hypothetical protein LQL77_29590 [Rhodococcus cerastii]|nr:hypothetical protein [Rhodococcus cerastii]
MRTRLPAAPESGGGGLYGGETPTAGGDTGAGPSPWLRWEAAPTTTFACAVWSPRAGSIYGSLFSDHGSAGREHERGLKSR